MTFRKSVFHKDYPITIPYHLAQDIADLLRTVKVNPWIQSQMPIYEVRASLILKHFEHYLTRLYR